MDKRQNMVLGSLIGDSFALGLHWIYDMDRIDKLRDDFSGLMAPQVKQYHGSKSKGEHTHYGDQTLWLLRSIAANRGFDRDQFAGDWLESMKSYDGYIDHASKETIENPDSGSSSDDLSGASRIAPILCAYADQGPRAIEASAEQTSFTHNNPLTVQTSKALASITLSVLEGTSPDEAVRNFAQSMEPSDPLIELFEKAMSSSGADTRETIGQMGRQCSLTAALPASLHVVLSYPDDFREAMVQNVLAGGDQAARGLAIGMILGAAGCKIPKQWPDEYAYRDEVMSLLSSIETKS